MRYTPLTQENILSTYCMMIRPIENFLSSTEVQKHHQKSAIRYLIAVYDRFDARKIGHDLSTDLRRASPARILRVSTYILLGLTLVH